MKALLFVLLSMCGVLTLHADGSATDTDPTILALRQSFPPKDGARDDIYSDCQQWFQVVSTRSAVKGVVAHASETKTKYLNELNTAKASGVAQAEKARLQASIAWLNGPFTTYLNQWRKLGELPEGGAETSPESAADSAPADKDVSDLAGKALAMVKEIRATEAGFMSGHTGFKQDLAKLETTAQAVADANGSPTAPQADALRAAIAAAIQRAADISTRTTEKAAAKTKAKDLETQLRSL